MKRILLLTAILFLGFIGNVFAGNLRAYLSYATFVSPLDGPYLESYISVVGNSVVFRRNDNNKFQGAIQITMIFRQDSIIRDFKKYDLLSPETEDTTMINFNFIDQQRFLLPNGKYNLEISIADKFKDHLPFKVIEPVEINFPPDKINLSGIQLIESFRKTDQTGILTKSGYDFVPMVDNFYPSSVNKLTFYAELYNAEKVLGTEQKFIITNSIESAETGKIVTIFHKIRKETAHPVNVIFSEFDISQLPSGNYFLTLEARDKENVLVARNQVFFQRSNPSIQFNIGDITALDITNTFVSNITNMDTLKEYIRSLYPISTNIEAAFANNQLKTANLQMLQQFFLNFWLSRNNQNPQKAWELYNIEVSKAQVSFHTRMKKGYETDRGRTFLKYGPPNTIVDRPYERDVVPYQVWHYYKLGTYTDKRFIFYEPDLITNDFQMLHSDVPGEITNQNWQEYLVRNKGNNLDPDQRAGSAKMLDDFMNPR
jgi:GWxTD domain-containing protein